jgi:hypothetical protein
MGSDHVTVMEESPCVVVNILTGDGTGLVVAVNEACCDLIDSRPSASTAVTNTPYTTPFANPAMFVISISAESVVPDTVVAGDPVNEPFVLK